MASMTIRGIDESLKKRLRIQAALHGCSMEEEAREILRSALSFAKPIGVKKSLLESIRSRVESIGWIDIEAPVRDAIRTPPEI